MSQREVLRHSVGVTGPDGVGKTGFALDIVNFLRLSGQRAIFCPFPFLPGTMSGKILRHAKEERVAPIAIKPIYSMNRVEVLPALKQWVSSDERNWVVFDRVWQDGPVFAEALGPPGDSFESERKYKKERGLPVGNQWADYQKWLHNLEVWFPEVEHGFYVTRPLKESMEIMGRRKEAESVKSDFDKNVMLQRRVRRLYPREFAGLSNWTTIHVHGVVSSHDISKWQVPYLRIMWLTLSERTGNPQWADDTDKKIERAQRMSTRAQEPVERETMKTMYMLSRRSGIRGVRSWVPEAHG